MPIPIVQVDAFTARPFAGNPAAVCVLPEPRDAAWMQTVARQMNLSETAFLLRQDGGFNLRWFTPAIEVDLCGHATLGSAHVLWETGQLAAGSEARFHTRSGWLKAAQHGDWIEMDFPAKLETATDPPPVLLEALGCQPVYVGKNQFDYLIEVGSEEELRSLRPNHALLKTLPVRGAIVTSRSAEFDFVSRFFAPGAGVEEDPVTGSAHCALAPYWGKKLGRTEMRAFQVSERGGEVRVRLRGDRVILAGQAVTVWRGELLA
ncbi:MAG TPA: hypothetical protein DEQ47_18770 [Solibacterales bacterium]|nr:hypothetical protein [Bryobacterales bacterium]